MEKSFSQRSSISLSSHCCSSKYSRRELLSLLFFPILLLCISYNVTAARIKSSNSGLWSEEANWHKSIVPQAGDIIIIQSGDVIKLDSDIEPASLIIMNGAVLDAGEFVIRGTGSFELRDGGTLITAHPLGISLSGITGTICTSTASFSPSAIYHFNGTTSQVSGDALPVNSSITIVIDLQDDALEFRFTTRAMINLIAPGKLEIRSGTLVEEENPALGRAVSGTGELIMKGGFYRIKSTFTTKGTSLPRLSGDFSNGESGPPLGTIILAGTKDLQYLRSARAYNDIIFTGGGTKIISNATPDINGTVTIDENVVVNQQSFDFGDSITNLVMTGGRLIIKKTEVCPTMGGIYTLTGGVIEFANDNLTTQTIRARTLPPIIYHNIEITGSNVANSNTSIDIAGTFTIKPHARFRLASNRFITGTGSFVVEDDATFLYGNTYGIKTTGISSTSGNIRVTGERIFSPLATYGFTGGVDQVTGNALPLVVKGLLIEKDTTKIVTLSQPVTVTGEIFMKSGILATGNMELYLSNPSPQALLQDVTNTAFGISYITGSFKRAVSTQEADYVFPIGEIDGQQTVVINFNNDVSTDGPAFITASFHKDLPNDYYTSLPLTTDDVTINTISDEGYWEIIPSSGSLADYNLTLSARGFEKINNPEMIRIVKRDGTGGSWQIAGVNPTSSFTNDQFYFTQTHITGFSHFTLGSDYTINPLPVEWLEVKAERVGDDVVITWQTASETNSHYYVVSRSVNRLDFTEEIVTLPAAGFSSSTNTFSCTDHNPLPGLSYYIIKTVDFDGEYSFSPVMPCVVTPHTTAAISFNRHYINLRVPEDAYEWNCTIYTLEGLKILSRTIPTPGLNILKAELPVKGVVIIHLTNNIEQVNTKLYLGDY